MSRIIYWRIALKNKNHYTAAFKLSTSSEIPFSLLSLWVPLLSLLLFLSALQDAPPSGLSCRSLVYVRTPSPDVLEVLVS